MGTTWLTSTPSGGTTNEGGTRYWVGKSLANGYVETHHGALGILFCYAYPFGAIWGMSADRELPTRKGLRARPG